MSAALLAAFANEENEEEEVEVVVEEEEEVVVVEEEENVPKIMVRRRREKSPGAKTTPFGEGRERRMATPRMFPRAMRIRNVLSVTSGGDGLGGVEGGWIGWVASLWMRELSIRVSAPLDVSIRVVATSIPWRRSDRTSSLSSS